MYLYVGDVKRAAEDGALGGECTDMFPHVFFNRHQLLCFNRILGLWRMGEVYVQTKERGAEEEGECHDFHMGSVAPPVGDPMTSRGIGQAFKAECCAYIFA